MRHHFVPNPRAPALSARIVEGEPSLTIFAGHSVAFGGERLNESIECALCHLAGRSNRDLL
jgi:hypothetical protein